MRLHVIINGPNLAGPRSPSGFVPLRPGFVPSRAGISDISRNGQNMFLRRLGQILGLAGAACVLGAGLTWITEAVQEKHDRTQYLASLHSRVLPDPDNPPLSGSINKPLAAKLPAVLGVLNIDRVGLSVLVRPGDDAAMLATGAGWIPGTSQPGQSGNIGISGHRDTFFRKLEDVRIGDTIALVSGAGQKPYVVRETRVVSPDQVEVLKPTTESTLTLVTCYPFHFIGSAPKRYIVRATQY
jgi:sortase A